MWSRWQFVLAGVLLGACGPTIPKELANARSTYAEMQTGSASATVPDEARRAREALQTAESAFQEEGASDRTRELSVIAERAAMSAQTACAQRSFAQVQPPPAPAPEVVEKVRVEEKVRDVLAAVPGTVFFEFDKADLRPEAKERLDQLGEALTDAKYKDQGQTLIISGFADSTGPAEYNKELSERRAEAVRSYLGSHGYDPNLVQIKAMGEESPFATNATAEGRADNRRVEIQLGAKKGGE